MASAVGRALAFVSLAFWNTLCLFASYILLCGILIFQNNRGHSAIFARRPRLVLVGATASLTIVVFFVCASYNLRVLLWVEVISKQVFNGCNRVSSFIFSCSLLTGIVWAALRFWLAYFDIRWGAHWGFREVLNQLQLEGQHSHDDDEDAISDDSLHKTIFNDKSVRETFGNEKWMTTRVAIANVFLVAFAFLLAFIEYSLVMAFTILSLICFAAFMFILRRAMPAYDMISLCEELRAFCRYLIVGVIGSMIWLIAIVVDIVASDGSLMHPCTSPTLGNVIAFVISMHCLLICAFGSGFVPTLYVIYCTDLVKEEIDGHYTLAWLRPAVAKYRQLMKILCCSGCTVQRSVAAVSGAMALSPRTQRTTTLTMKEVMTHMRSLELFVTHLIREYSMETMAAMIEMTLFHKRWSDEFHAPFDSFIQFPVELEALRTAIVNDTVPLTSQFVELVDKYVEYGVEFAINLSYRCRQVS